LQPERSNPQPRKSRKKALLALIIGTAVLIAVVFSQTAFNLTFLRPESSQQILIFAALSALIFLLLVTLSVILVRNLLKLYAERRGGVVGSKFRTRMVIGALVLSFTPVIFLYLFAYQLMNRSIDKWFSRPVEEVREDTAEIATLVANYAAENANLEARSIAIAPETARAYATGNFSGVMNQFRSHELTIQSGFALALSRDRSIDRAPQASDTWTAEASFHAPEAWSLLRPKLPADLAPRPSNPRLQIDGRVYVLGVASAGEGGRIIVGMPLPQHFTATLDRIDASGQRYLELASQRKLVRRTYMGYLLLLTVLVLFAAMWFALFLSKLVTRPVAALADAMQEVSRGRLDYRVQVAAADELGDLVSSFNAMAGELESNRRQIEASSRDLAGANAQLEQRRRQIETILESIPTGVLSLDANRRVTHANNAFTRMFSTSEGGDLAGSAVAHLFPAEVADDLLRLMRKSERMGATTSQMEINVARSKLDVAVTVAALKHASQQLGYVIVFEDLSDVLKAQKQAAWREVARRVAHEIKNPLTPIALSAERIKRHLQRGGPPDDASLAVIHGCVETIAGAVETVRTLVDEFSALARFPNARPQPANINAIVESALAMFNGRLDGIRVQTFLAPDLPRVMADPEAFKRAIANLVDNAAEAMQESLLREVHISTALLGSRDAVEIVIADTGHGVSREMKEKLFLPYFSTKRRGTGLGLAIVSRIVEEHHGSIRVEENSPLGARFIVELPIASEGAAATTHG
jgi:two-component system, NtrC family, nitrogen regulation sensor histidine kinase NtrY